MERDSGRGPQRLAVPIRTRIVRVKDGKEQYIPGIVDSIIKGDKSQDILLHPGDIIVIPQTYY